MKALQIALLVVAGAMVGAVVMMVWPRPWLSRMSTSPPAVSRVAKPVPVVVLPPEPPATSTAAESKPEPMAPAEAAAPIESRPAPPAVKPAPNRRPANPPAQSERAESRNNPGRVAPKPERVAVLGNPPVRPAAPRSVQDPRSSGSSVSRTYPEEVSVPMTAPEPAPLPLPTPQSAQGLAAPSPNPSARLEQEHATPVPPPSPEPHRATLNAGTIIPVRLVDALSTERNRPGDTFNATLVNELVAGEFVIAERGARVEGQVVASDPGRSGPAVLTVVLTRLHTSDGQNVAIRTDGFERRAQPISVAAAAPPGNRGRPGSGNGSPGSSIIPMRGVPATLAPDSRIPFRLGVSVALTERIQ